jgi:hypothetical protein
MAAISLVLWLTIAALGRLIAYQWENRPASTKPGCRGLNPVRRRQVTNGNRAGTVCRNRR